MKGYGQTGPYATAAGYDVVIEAEAGLMHMYVANRSLQRDMLMVSELENLMDHHAKLVLL